MKKSDLHRKWARVLDMCEGTEVDPNDCWKFNGESKHRYPSFDSVGTYDFMVAILESKPVFIGDKLYGKISKQFSVIEAAEVLSGECDCSDAEYWSWNEPKHTFKINGVELPCPNSNGEWILHVGPIAHRFESIDDYEKVRNSINKILKDATR